MAACVCVCVWFMCSHQQGLACDGGCSGDGSVCGGVLSLGWCPVMGQLCNREFSWFGMEVNVDVTVWMGVAGVSWSPQH